MIDALSMPALAILVVVYLVFVWSTWLKDKNGRALNIPADEEREDQSGFHD